MPIKKGFMLVSFLVYLLFFSVIISFFVHTLFMVIVPSLSSLRTTQAIISLHTASDLFVRDIRKMRSIDHRWQLVLDKEIIWSAGDGVSVGWKLYNGCLGRREGIYKGKWSKCSKSLVAKGLSDAFFRMDRDKKGIELILVSRKTPQKVVNCYVSLRGKG